MTINITPEITEAFEKYMDDVIDFGFNGTPLLRRHVIGTSSPLSILNFAAGYQAAQELAEATKMTDEGLQIMFKALKENPTSAQFSEYNWFTAGSVIVTCKLPS